MGAREALKPQERTGSQDADYPAIDLKDGACVRLRQVRMEDSTVFSDDPVSMAASGSRAAAVACTWSTSTVLRRPAGQR
ncbi:hypothetical protein GTA26_28555 [Rhodococcus hoagii]|nr:hypothetical protein [Prescottella equi]